MNDIGSVLVTGAGLLMFWLLVYFGWRPYRIDRVRMELFKVRNALFLCAAEGAVSFDDPAYRILRDRINALIRHAHMITVTRSLIFMVAERFYPNVYVQASHRNWLVSVSKLPEISQSKIQQISNRLAIVLAKQLITGSPFVFAMVALWVGTLKINRLLRRDPRESLGLRVAKEFRVELIEEQATMAQTQERLIDARELAHA